MKTHLNHVRYALRTMCGKRNKWNEIPTTDDWNEVTCKGCLKAGKMRGLVSE